MLFRFGNSTNNYLVSHVGLTFVFTRNCSRFQRSGTARAASSQPTMRSVCRFNHKAFCYRPADQTVSCVLCPSGIQSASSPNRQPAAGQRGRSLRQRLHPRQRSCHDLHVRGKTGVLTFSCRLRRICVPSARLDDLQERVNTCRFWDPQSGVWLLLPLQWEVNVDFVKARVQRVMVRETLCLFSTHFGCLDGWGLTRWLDGCLGGVFIGK